MNKREKEIVRAAYEKAQDTLVLLEILKKEHSYPSKEHISTVIGEIESVTESLDKLLS